jgi:16S rRNA (cytidine1402-2'-O)-methyltransferase
MSAKGRLWLMPNALDLGTELVDLREVIPDGVIRRAANLTHWAVEDARSARAFLKRVHTIHPLAQPLQALDIRELPRPRKGQPVNKGGAKGASSDDSADWQALLQPALAGADVGLLSEAGLPAVADPGARLVALAHAAGIEVVALSGPSSLMLALAASGLEGQNFAFVGYLPQDAAARQARIQALEKQSRQLQQTQLVIETPYRNAALAQALLAHLSPGTRLHISSGLTLPGGFSRMATVAAWRQSPPQLSDRMPTVFAWLA